MTEFYRFRSTKYILGEKYQELKNQNIYFAPPTDLNDPMEGFKDIFWSGDNVVWRNLFKHYMLCLINSACLALIDTTTFDAKLLDNIVFAVPEDLPDADIRFVYQEACQDFFYRSALHHLLRYLSKHKRKIRKEELISYIRSIHPYSTRCSQKGATQAWYAAERRPS